MKSYTTISYRSELYQEDPEIQRNLFKGFKVESSEEIGNPETTWGSAKNIQRTYVKESMNNKDKYISSESTIDV